MQHDQSYGVIPIHRDAHGRRRYLLVQHKAGHWGFPKGHPEPGETPVDTARRELAEETAVHRVRLLDQPVLEEQYIFHKRTGGKVQKTVTYFLGHVDDPATTACAKELHGCAWLEANEARDRLTFDEGRRLLDAAEQALATAGC
ncbi:MAG: NUDIX domain-containing protein [Phycisphaeraceae bacterium]